MDALSRRRQSFRQVWYKSAVDCMRIEKTENATKCPKIAYSSVVKKTSIALLSQGGRAIASIVKYLEHSFFFYIISYFGFIFTSAYNSILFCYLRRNSNLAVMHTIRGRVWCETALGRSRTVGYHAWRLVGQYPQSQPQVRYTTKLKQLLIVKPDIR